MEKLYCGDALEILKQLPDNYVSVCITDPPYGLSEHDEKTIREVLTKWLSGEEDYIPKKKGMLGKDWDAFVPPPALWKEVYRVLKPGANILVFAGSRTYDLMTMSLRLAGFEIKDTIIWIYSQGFPKAYDIAKGIESKIKQGSANWTDWKNLDGEKYERKTGYVKLQAEQGYRNDYTEAESKDIYLTTPEAKMWEGYKTALKPAFEPIILAMKPCDKNYVNNALKWGTAGLNIDACRIEFEDTPDPATNPKYRLEMGYKLPPRGQKSNGTVGFSSSKNITNPKGRYPANVILQCTCDELIEKEEKIAKNCAFTDKKQSENWGTRRAITKNFPSKYAIHTDPQCPCYMLDQQSGISKRKDLRNSSLGGFPTQYVGGKPQGKLFSRPLDFGGGASRFFYCAKASKKERNMGCEDLPKKPMSELNKIGGEKSNFKTGSGNERDIYLHNNHPTVKPLKLCEYLVKLTLMPDENQIYLDPFMGSGSILMAVKKMGRSFIGIEINKEYFEIAKKRLEAI